MVDSVSAVAARNVWDGACAFAQFPPVRPTGNSCFYQTPPTSTCSLRILSAFGIIKDNLKYSHNIKSYHSNSVCPKSRWRILGSKVGEVQPKILCRPSGQNAKWESSRVKAHSRCSALSRIFTWTEDTFKTQRPFLEASDSDYYICNGLISQKVENEKSYCIIICCGQYVSEMSSLMLKWPMKLVNWTQISGGFKSYWGWSISGLF